MSFMLNWIIFLSRKIDHFHFIYFDRKYPTHHLLFKLINFSNVNTHFLLSLCHQIFFIINIYLFCTSKIFLIYQRDNFLYFYLKKERKIELDLSFLKYPAVPVPKLFSKEKRKKTAALSTYGYSCTYFLSLSSLFSLFYIYSSLSLSQMHKHIWTKSQSKKNFYNS